MTTEKTSRKTNKVLVVGSGVAGMKASVDLAEMGREVLLIEKAPSIGGFMTQLDRTFPTNNCDMCTISSCLAEINRQDRFELLTLTDVARVEGEAGDFTVTLTTRPRYIDLEKCTACGQCVEKYPEWVSFTPGMDARAPTCMRYPQATPYAYSIDMDRVTDAEALEKVCPFGAISLDDQPVDRTVQVGAIVLAAGAELFNPEVLDTYGYGRLPNVVSGLEYERILYATGPTKGELVRPSDGKRPEKVAWIQCAGSRNMTPGSLPYCSSVCCMYALKEAMITKERVDREIDTVLFYMDMRTYGKDYERYYQRAKDELGIRFVRCRPHTVEAVPDSSDLMISYLVEGSEHPETERFDMVVLATGFYIPPEGVALAEKLGIELNEHNFVETTDFRPVATSKPGIYVAGILESPKDIPETLVQASAAACMAAGDTGADQAAAAEEFPPERDVTGEEPKIGVFLLDFEDNAGTLDLSAVAEYAKMLPGVFCAEVIPDGHTPAALDAVRRIIEEKRINRVVVGAGSPRTEAIPFQDTIRRAGLNRHLLEVINFREQVLFAHQGTPDAALLKAKDAVRMAVAGVALAQPFQEVRLPMNKDALVIGGGVAGMNAALHLAEEGHKVYLLEKTGELGGLARKVYRTLAGEDVQAYLKDLIARVNAHDCIEILTHAEVVDHEGVLGRFQTGVRTGTDSQYRRIEHGVAILATGALANRPSQYLLGEHDSVMTQQDLDALAETDPDRIKQWKNVVMIQCVGSREEENPNCSRVCCQAAIKNALRLLERNPDLQVYVLYRDMRTFGLMEGSYQEARRKGVIFVKYTVDAKPQVAEDGTGVSVRFNEPILGREIEVSADALVLSTGLVSDASDTEALARKFRLSRTEDGYFAEDHPKLRPVDLTNTGFFVAGTAHAPKTISESIAQAQAAAGRALTFLNRDYVTTSGIVAQVDQGKCAVCLTCVRACPFDVPFICEDGYSQIDPEECRGCGVCVAECPGDAIRLRQFERDRINTQIDRLLEGIL